MAAMRDELARLVATALGNPSASASPSLVAGQADAMRMVDTAISECANRQDAVHLASSWVDQACTTGQPYLLWAAGAILEIVASSSRLWLKADASLRRHTCALLLKASHSEMLAGNSWISSKVHKALSSAAIHEWPDNFPEFAPAVASAFNELHPVMIQLSTVVLNRAAEIAVSRKSTAFFRKFGSISMNSREKLQNGLKDIVPFLFQSANSALSRCGHGLMDKSSNAEDSVRIVCKAALEAISECLKIAEENAIKLQVEMGTIQILFSLSKSFLSEQGLACKSLECIAEITSQSSICLDDENYFKLIMQELIALISYCKQNTDEELAKILVNISCILISKHITRLENSPVLGSALVQLLTEIFQLSFDTNNHRMIICSLDVWEIILEHVESEQDISYGSQSSLNEMYRSCNLSVANSILRRLFLYTPEGQKVLVNVDSTPGSALESLSELQLQEHTQGRDVSDFSELDHYHSRCEEIFGLLLDIYPQVLLQVCIQCFQETNSTYGAIFENRENIFKCGSNISTLSHDISTCLRLVTRCAPKFSTIEPETAESIYFFVLNIANHVLSVYEIAASCSFPQSDPEEVAKYLDVNGKLAYNCLSMFSMWIRFLASNSQGDKMQGIVKAYLDCSVKPFELSASSSPRAISENVLISAAGALSSFSTVVQPSIGQMQGIQSFQTLTGLLQTIMGTAPQRATSSIWVFLTDSLLKRVDSKQSQAEHFAKIEAEFTNLVSMPASILMRGIDPQVSMSSIHSAAHTLSAIVRSFGGKTHSARRLLSNCISGVLPSCVNVIKGIAQNPSIDHTGKVAGNMIQLIIASFDVIAKEMGDDLITSTVKEFIELYSNPVAMKTLSVDTGASLMELLTLLARRPGGSKFKALSLQTMQFCFGIWSKLPPGGKSGVSHSDLLILLIRILRYQSRACDDTHVQGVLDIFLNFCIEFGSETPREVLSEVLKLDEQTKFFSSRGFSMDQAKVSSLVCSLTNLFPARPDLGEALLGTIYKILLHHPTCLQNAAIDVSRLKMETFAEFSSSFLNVMNDVIFLSSLRG